EIIKIQAEKTKLENKLKDKIKKGHFVKDALMEKWRTPSAELLEAIEDYKNGNVETYANFEEYKKALKEE
ncbi:hypothetical protein D6198_09500, partial [Campylobacter coli]|nr:hypothetical protein [Campylobacter coli]